MNGIKSILTSGRAPGVRCGMPAVDPNSVFALAPKAFKEIERGEGRSAKQGPMSARAMAKYMGLGSVDRLKKIWQRTNSRAFGCFLAILVSVGGSSAGYSAKAGMITPGISFTDGQTVHAADLNNAIGNSTINSLFYTGNPISLSPQTSDYTLIYSPTLNGFYKLTLQSFFFGNTNILASIGLSVSPSVNVSLLNFSNVLTDYSPPQPSPLNMSNMVQFLTWDTNGVPYQISESNLLYSLGYQLNTNFDIPYRFLQMFAPWTLYGTNSTTNAWGYTTNFPITSLYLTNSFNPTNSTPTLSGTDTIPVNSGGQSTNTTSTLTALGQFFLSKNMVVTPTNSLFFANTNGAITPLAVGYEFLLTNMLATNAVATNYTWTLKNNQFVSTNVTLSLGGGSIANFAHGFTNTPSEVRWVMVCVTNNTGYNVGDEVSVSSFVTSASLPAFGFGANNTNVFLTLEASGTLRLMAKTNGTDANVTAAYWNAKCYASP